MRDSRRRRSIIRSIRRDRLGSTGQRDEPDKTAPGRPTTSGSRQQTHPDQSAQTGEPELDRKLTDHGGKGRPEPQPSAK